MGTLSGWEEESYREEYIREERQRGMKDMSNFDALPIRRSRVVETQQKELEDLFRPCTKEDPCGACPACCEEERGSKN